MPVKNQHTDVNNAINAYFADVVYVLAKRQNNQITPRIGEKELIGPRHVGPGGTV
jgi:hypothetical protein